jgi:hypothetical protein
MMGGKTDPPDVPLGKTKDGTKVSWRTGKIYTLPTSKRDNTCNQSLPQKAINDKDTAPDVAQWFMPESKTQPFLDFFVLAPAEQEEMKCWQLLCIQNTIGRKHTADINQLIRVVNGIMNSGYNLCGEIVVAYVIEDFNKSGTVGMKESTTIKCTTTNGSRKNGTSKSIEYTVKPLHIAHARSGGVPM